jgi:hypothetical protein
MGKKSKQQKGGSNSKFVWDDLVAKLANNRIQSLPQHLRQASELKAYLFRIMQPADKLAWLTIPLMKGLMHGPPDIDVRIRAPAPVTPNDPWPLLMWLCQWKLLQKLYGWKGGDDIVAMVIAAGADVHAESPLEKWNAAFLAVTYGSPVTLQLLIGAGIHLQHRGINRRTCLYNALEYPSPSMLRYLLLDHHLSSTDMMAATSTSRGLSFPMSTADFILSLFFSGPNSASLSMVHRPASWVNFGPPSIGDVAESLIMLRQQGAVFTWNEGTMDFWKNMADHSANLRQPRDIERLSESLLGYWLPTAIHELLEQESREELAHHDSVETGKTQECPICRKPLQKMVTLYCSHSFCRHCIVQYGVNGGSSCPLCRGRLCKEIVGAIVPPTEEAARDLYSLFGLTNAPFSDKRGPQCLSDKQVLEEATVEGMDATIPLATLREMLSARVSQGHNEQLDYRTTFQASRRDADAEEILLGSTSKVVSLELSSTHSVIYHSKRLNAPRQGPAMIEIKIKGIPVIARISNNSFYTCVSASVVKIFKLKRLENLSSSKFRDGLTGRRLRATCLEDFTFSLGEVVVSLYNAVEVDPGMQGAGVQLGVDFFLSAAWCVVDVTFGTSITKDHDQDGKKDDCDSLFRTDGVRSCVISGCKLESLRYYAHDGKTAHVTVLHYNPLNHMNVGVVTLKRGTEFEECNWCLRTFPGGYMAQCGVCKGMGENIFYCDERCQRAAWKIHCKKEAHCGTNIKNSALLLS